MNECRAEQTEKRMRAGKKSSIVPRMELFNLKDRAEKVCWMCMCMIAQGKARYD